MPARILRCALAGAAVLGLAACSKEPPPPAAPATARHEASPEGRPAAWAAPPNLVLITMDTTRADHLGCYGYTQGETPSLDALARDGVVFDRAIAVAPLTLPSHVAILTGLYPPRSGVRDNGDFRLPDAETTLAEHLKARGYRARASVGSYVLAGDLGLAQGFEHYAEPLAPKLAPAVDPSIARLERVPQRGALAVAGDAIAAIDAMKDGPFFLWVHFYDPHWPYAPPPEFQKKFPQRPYDGEIAAMDAQIGRVLDRLKSAGVYDRTIVAAIADHGEALGDHGEKTHGIFLYDATVRVPLILRSPEGLPHGARYAGLVSAVDLAPTLLELMGMPPLPAAQGRSVATALTGGSLPERDPVYLESLYGERAYGWAPLVALRTRDEKFIEAPESEIYALDTDPGETKNLAGSRGKELASWRKRLAATVTALGTADPSAAADDTDEQREALRSLGYVSAGAPGLARKGRPDPKRLLSVHLQYGQAFELVNEGKFDDAATVLAAALKHDPDNPAVQSLLGSVRFTRNRRAEGLGQLRAAAAAAPGVWSNQWNLGNALLVDGRPDEAVKAFRAIVAIHPEGPEGHYLLGNALAGAGHPGDAVKEYRRAIDLGLGTPPVTTALGSALLGAGDVVGAEASLRAAVAADPSFADAWNQLGILLDKTSRRPEALEAFTKAIQADPDHADALFNRAKIRLLSGDTRAARADLDVLLAHHADTPHGRFLEANVCVAEGNTAGARAALKTMLALPRLPANLDAAGRGMLKKLGD